MHTVKAIILKSIPHSEQQQILHVYSEERGYMQMITPLALFKRKANASAQCMQIVEIEFIPNERGGPESRSIRVYQNLRGIPEHHAG